MLEKLAASTVRHILHGGVQVPPFSAIIPSPSNQLTLFCPDQLSPVLAVRHHLHSALLGLFLKRLQQAKITARPTLEMASKQQNHMLNPRYTLRVAQPEASQMSLQAHCELTNQPATTTTYS